MRKQLNEAKAEAMWNNGLLDREIAEQFGVTASTVECWRRKNGMASNRDIFKWDPLGYVDPDKKGCKKYA